MQTAKLSSLALIAALAACTDPSTDVQTSADPTTPETASVGTTTNTLAARTAADAAIAFRWASRLQNGRGAAAAVALLATSAPRIVTPKGSGNLDERRALRDGGGTCECTPLGCIFDACDVGGVTIDGTIIWLFDVFTFDVTASYDMDGLAWTWAISGDVEIGLASVAGDLHSEGSGTLGDDLAWSWTVDVALDDIELDALGCPVDGSASADGEFEATGPMSLEGSVAGSGTVSFGPECGDISAS